MDQTGLRRLRSSPFLEQPAVLRLRTLILPRGSVRTYGASEMQNDQISVGSILDVDRVDLFGENRRRSACLFSSC